MLILNMFAEDNSWLTQILGMAKNKDISFYVLEEAINDTTFFVRFIKDYTKDTAAFRHTLNIPEQFLNSATAGGMVTIVGYDHGTNNVVMVFDVTEKDFREVVVATITGNEQADLDEWSRIGPKPGVSLQPPDEAMTARKYLSDLIKAIIPWYNVVDATRMPCIANDGTVYTYPPFNIITTFNITGDGYNALNTLLMCYEIGTSNTAELMGFYFALISNQLYQSGRVSIDTRVPDKAPLLALRQGDLNKLFTRFENANIDIKMYDKTLVFTLLKTK